MSFFGKCNFAFNLKICILALFKALNRTLKYIINSFFVICPKKIYGFQ